MELWCTSHVAIRHKGGDFLEMLACQNTVFPGMQRQGDFLEMLACQNTVISWNCWHDMVNNLNCWYAKTHWFPGIACMTQQNNTPNSGVLYHCKKKQDSIVLMHQYKFHKYILYWHSYMVCFCCSGSVIQLKICLLRTCLTAV